MKTVGLFLVLLGASSYILPMLGRHSFILSFFGAQEKFAAPAAIGLGVVILLLGLRKKKSKDEKK